MAPRLLLPVVAALALAACDRDTPAASGAGGTTPRFEAPTLAGGCPDESPARSWDLDRDGRPDFVEIPDGTNICRAGDLNFDSAFDIFRHRDAAGNLLREEADSDYDGRIDIVASYGGGSLLREDFDTNWDGRLDLWVDLRRDCAFDRAPAATCTSDCAIDWCRPRALLAAEDPPPAPREGPPPESAVLYRDSNGDGLWDTAEVLLGEHPVCVGFNVNVFGDTPDTVRPEIVEVYKPSGLLSGRPDLDYLRRDYLDLAGNPIVRCEDADGAIAPCPSPCGGG